MLHFLLNTFLTLSPKKALKRTVREELNWLWTTLYCSIQELKT